MKIGILSDCRVPTLPYGGHGLGRAAIDLARGLTRRGHTVTLYAGPGSQWEGVTALHEHETLRAHQLDAGTQDVWVDLSHYHDLSRVQPEAKVVNYLLDLECPYAPPNALVVNEWHRARVPGAWIAPLGVDVDAIPLGTGVRTYLTYVAKIIAHKGYDVALKVANLIHAPVYMVGEVFVPDPIPNYRGVMNSDAELHAWLGGALALLSPSRLDVGGRVNLEAAACGTPTLCLDATGTQCHVEHGLSGFICADAAEMADAVADGALLDGARMRAWVAETHGLNAMAGALDSACQRVRDGEGW